MISTATQTISCTVSRVVHPREPFTDGQPRFCVLLTSAGKATGMLPFYPETGMRLKLTGERREYNGELQFKFSRALHDAPADPKALLDYVASIAKGIGPKTAERIWAEHGAEWQERIDDMKPSVSLALHRTMDALAANKARSELTVYMISIGGSPRMADAAWAAWGENAAATIEANPYLLATLPGLGFKTVDGDIRKHFRIGDSDIRRATAAIDYALRDMMETSGDSVVSRDALYSQFHELNVPRSVASIAMAKLVGSGRVVFVGMDKVTTSQVVKHEGDLYRYITDNASSQPAKLFIPYDAIRDIDVKFDDSQVIAIAAATSNVGLTVINGGAGSGKCLGRGTPVIMYDMTIKNVEDIRVGDILLGPNGEQKHVTSITSGHEEMFRVTPKRGGEAFTCNRSHILSVLHTRKRIRDYTDDAKKCFNISVDDILTKLNPEHRKHLKCWHADCVNRPTRDVLVDPYFLGVWLGDGAGSKGIIRITNSDKEIIDWLFGYANKCGLNVRIRPGYFKHTCPQVEMYSPLGRGARNANPLVNAMNKLGLWGNKHIPHCYIDNSVSIRLSLLAGLLDSDGYLDHGVYEITQKSERLANDIVFLARSLGFGVSIKPCRKQCCNNGVWGDYFRVVISGDIDKIPCIVERRKAHPRKQTKNPRIHGITIEFIGDGEYFGFTLAEEDGLFLLGDFTVTHNTTIIKAICQILERRGCSVDLCAFAGKAAARLREATGHRASTIHSMLAFSGEGLGFTAGNLHGRSVVVDEASMVPSSLLYEITKRDPERLILVGDQAQLQPVGIGSPFHDVIDTLPTVVHTLTTCYRNKEAVFAAASQVRNGNLPDEGKSRNEEFAVMRFDTPEAVHAYVDELVKSGSIDFGNDLVLSPRNGDGEEPAAATVKSLNASIQALQNPHEEGVKFLAEDRVMCTKNFPKLDIWNGTTGWITRVDYAGKPYFLPDDADSEYDEIRLGEKEQQAAITPAWCLTVHKAQGSQYRDVYVVCLRRDAARLFDRSMLYTAITRAKRKCVLLTDDGIDRIIGAVRRRNTYLRHLFKGEV